MNIFEKQYWHDDFVAVIMSIAWFMTAIWTFITKHNQMFTFLHYFTMLWVLMIAAFGGKRFVEALQKYKSTQPDKEN